MRLLSANWSHVVRWLCTPQGVFTCVCHRYHPDLQQLEFQTTTVRDDTWYSLCWGFLGGSRWMVSVSHIINKSNFTVRVSDRFFGAFWSRVMPFFFFLFVFTESNSYMYGFECSRNLIPNMPNSLFPGKGTKA